MREAKKNLLIEKTPAKKYHPTLNGSFKTPSKEKEVLFLLMFAFLLILVSPLKKLELQDSLTSLLSQPSVFRNVFS